MMPLTRTLLIVGALAAVTGGGLFVRNAIYDKGYADAVAVYAKPLEVCRRARDDLTAAVAQRNDQLREQSAAVTATLAAQAKALADTQRQVRDANARASAALRPLKSVGACERMREVDDRFLGSLR